MATPYTVEAVTDDEEDFVATVIEDIERRGQRVVRGPVIYTYNLPGGPGCPDRTITSVTMEVEQRRNYNDRG